MLHYAHLKFGAWPTIWMKITYLLLDTLWMTLFSVVCASLKVFNSKQMTFTGECKHLGKGIDATMGSSAKEINHYAEFIFCKRKLNTSTMVRHVLAAYVANHITSSFIEKKKRE